MRRMYRKHNFTIDSSQEERAIMRQWGAIGRQIAETAEWERGVSRINALSKAKPATGKPGSKVRLRDQSQV